MGFHLSLLIDNTLNDANVAVILLPSPFTAPGRENCLLREKPNSDNLLMQILIMASLLRVLQDV